MLRRTIVALLILVSVFTVEMPSRAAPDSAGRTVQTYSDFSNGPQGWHTSGGEWSAASGAFTVRNPDSGHSAIATPKRALFADEQTIEAVVRVDRRLAADGWSMAGILLQYDDSNYWVLSLTEDAQGKRYVDFLENFRGVWQAQNEAGTQLVARPRSGSFAWVPGRNYRLSLALSATGIAAQVKDEVTSETVAEASYAFGNAPAVKMGSIALIARGVEAQFGKVAASQPNQPGTLPSISVEKGRRGAVAILRDQLPGADMAAIDALADALIAAGFGVTALTASDVSNINLLDPRLFSLFVVPNAEVYPADGATALVTYLRRRGNLLLLGGPPFSRPVWRSGGEWLDRNLIRERIARIQAGRVFLDFDASTDPATWSRSSDNMAVASRVTVDPNGPEPGVRALRFSMDGMTGWNTFASPSLPGMFTQGHNLLTFWARGDENTRELAVEVQETDNSRWIATVPLKAEWTYHVLSLDDFRYWHDSRVQRPRGGASDRLNPQAATRIVLGLSSSHTRSVGSGPHTFSVARFGTAVNPYAGVVTAGAEDAFLPLETVTPSYKQYRLQDIASVVAAADQSAIRSDTFPVPAAAFSSLVRPMGRGYGQDSRWRWIPLLEARDAAGIRRGTPAWILLNQSPPFTDSAVAVFAVPDRSALAAEPYRRAIVDTALRLHSGALLLEGGSRQFSWWPGEKVEVGATVANRNASPSRLRVRFTIATAQGKRLFEHVAPVAVTGDEQKTVTATWDPRGHNEAVRITTELLSDEATIDTIRHEIGFLSTTPAKRDAFVSARDGDFWLRGKKWYPVGVNYWPLYVSGLEPTDYNRGWLVPGYYDPEEVERDLEQMKAMGLNLVSIQMGGREAQRNLLDFLRRCARHGIYVNGFLGGASPIAYNESGVNEYIRAGRLADNPTLFAYDTIWEPGNSMFNAAGRVRWEPEWQRWIVEQYGSVAAAEADWGFAAPRREGKVTGPTDAQMREDGAWRVMVAAYRRFMDDLMSRKWNVATRLLRTADPNHLISYRQGNTLPHDFALTATGRHIDFISPEGYSIPHDEKGYNAVGFKNRFVHYTTAGKPIFWSEFGRSVWDGERMEPDASQFAALADYHSLFYKAALESGANGAAPWWWPGGYRVNERSDFGIVNPDRTPRPAALVLAEYAKRLKEPRTYPAPDTWMTIDRDTHAGGYWRLVFNEGAEAYRQARATGKNLGIRTAGTGTDSATTPLTAVGNRPYNGANPLKHLNAEFDRVQILAADGRWTDIADGATIRVAAGKPVRARVVVGNTEEATWLSPKSAGNRPGAVYLASAPGSGVTVRRPIAADVPRFAAADFGEFVLVEAVTANTPVALRLNAENRAWFGEKRSFTLEPIR